jgi:hypothetical protein
MQKILHPEMKALDPQVAGRTTTSDEHNQMSAKINRNGLFCDEGERRRVASESSL